MTSWSRGRTAILRAGAVFALLAAWVFAPSTASATCGDYVTTRAQREAHGLMSGPETTWHGGVMPDHAPKDRLPCSGPSCSRGRGVPDAPVVPVPVRTETWCDTACLPACAAPDRVTFLFDPPLLWPPRRASDFCRPPCPFPV